MTTQPTTNTFVSYHNLRYIPWKRSQTFRCPGVYIVWKGDQALYVGSGGNVRRRIQSRRRGRKGRDKAFRLRTHIEIVPCDSLQQARHLEVELIGIYRPLYNKQCRFKSSRTIEQLKAEHSKLFAISSLAINSQTSNQDSVLEVCS